MSLQLSLLSDAEVPRSFEIESSSYPDDEMATLENLTLRQAVAGDYFVACHKNGELIGFICSTRCQGVLLTDETMSVHDSSDAADTLCMHSVCVDASHRMQGVATYMLNQYIQRVVWRQPEVKRIKLMSKVHLLAFYTKCGFTLEGLWPDEHGAEPWYEMILLCAPLRTVPLTQVDAFTAEAFAGNPAAIVMLPPATRAAETVTGGFHIDCATDEHAGWMQAFAAEMNLSETAYVQPCSPPGPGERPTRFHLRWFTPTCEVDLCGHATVAASAALWDAGGTGAGALTFCTKGGELSAARPEGGSGWIELDFPVERAEAAEGEGLGPALAEGLGLLSGVGEAAVFWVGRNRMDVLVELTPAAFRAIAPSPAALSAIVCRGIIVTCAGEPGGEFHFHSRWFGPRSGIDEDPVTGSAHCALAPYWEQKLGLAGQKLRARQDSARSGVLQVQVVGGRVTIAGQAVVTLRGQVPLPVK